MQFDSVIKKRKSVRAFTKKKVPWRKIVDAVDTATQNPYAGNHNNIVCVIVEEKDMIKRIAKIAEQPWIEQSSTVITVCSNDVQLEDLYGERGRIYSRQQAGAAIQTILLKLIDSGLSACWVGAFSDDLIKQYLKIPRYLIIEALIPVGYENTREKQPKEEKIELEAALYWETWFTDKRPPLVKEAPSRRSLVND